MPPTRLETPLIVLSLTAIAFLTLGPANPSQPLSATCIFCGDLGGLDFILNVALFLPFGAGLRLRWGRTIPAIAAGVLLTLTIESLQWRIIPGRDASLGDLVANTIGTALGAWVAVHARAWATGTGRPAGRRAWWAVATTTVILVLTSVALLPVATPYLLWVQWAPRRPGMVPFPPHRLLSVELNGRRIGPVDILDRDRLVDRGTGTTELNVMLAQPIPPTTRRSAIVRLANNPHEGLFLGQERDGLLFRVFSVGSWLKLRTVLVRLDGAFRAATTTDSVAATLTSTRTAIRLAYGEGPARVEAVFRRSPGLAWTLLLPWDLAVGRHWWLANSAWLAGLVFPTALLSARARLPGMAWWRQWLPLIAVLAALIAIPTLVGISRPGWLEWLGIGMGTAAALALAQRTRAPATNLAGAESSRQL